MIDRMATTLTVRTLPQKLFYLVVILMLLAVLIGCTPYSSVKGTLPHVKTAAEKLVDAAQVGDVNEMKRLLATGLNVDRQFAGRSALMAAAHAGNVDAVKLLVQRKADVNARMGVTGETALMMAANAGRLVENLPVLPDIEVDQHRRDSAYVQIITTLMKNGANINVTNKNGDTALNFAAHSGQLTIVQLLLSNGAKINHKGYQGETALISGATALMCAAYFGMSDIVKMLLRSGAKIDVTAGELNDDALMLAANGSGADHPLKIQATKEKPYGTVYAGVIDILVKNGADINRKNANGYTPLMIAARSRQFENVQALIKYRNINLDVKGKDGKTAIMLAIEGLSGDKKIVTALVNRGANVNNKYQSGDWRGMTALHFAISNGNSDMADILLKSKSIDLNSKTKDGFTALALAIAAENVNMLSALLKRGTDVNFRMDQGVTALMIAAYKGNAEIVDILLKSGADINAIDQQGRTALLLANNGGHKKIAEMLLKAR